MAEQGIYLASQHSLQQPEPLGGVLLLTPLPWKLDGPQDLLMKSVLSTLRNGGDRPQVSPAQRSLMRTKAQGSGAGPA